MFDYFHTFSVIARAIIIMTQLLNAAGPTAFYSVGALSDVMHCYNLASNVK